MKAIRNLRTINQGDHASPIDGGGVQCHIT